MDLTIPTTRHYTVDEYLRLADESPVKPEYDFDSELMSGERFRLNPCHG